MSLSYCARCSKVFARGIRDICNNCYQEIEKEYDAVVTYLKAHKGAAMQEVSDETGVTLKQIGKFIRDGRISTVHSPNMSMPCEACGTPIREGSMCQSCRSKLERDVRDLKSAAQTPGAISNPANKKGGAFQIRNRL